MISAGTVPRFCDPLDAVCPLADGGAVGTAITAGGTTGLAAGLATATTGLVVGLATTGG
jgi:hypothetical protein